MKKLFLCLTFLCLLYQHFSFISAAQRGPTQVAILGGSASPESKEGFRAVILKDLLMQVKDKNPEAVFFLGDLVAGLVKNNSGTTLPNVYDSRGINWAKAGYTYSSEAYLQQLEAFSAVIKSTLGSELPFYPVIGFHESVGRNTAVLFKNHFKLKNEAEPIATPLAYSVSIGNAFFLLFATTFYDPVRDSIVQHSLNPTLLYWIKETLKKNHANYDYFFAMSYEPAFSTTASEGKKVGLDYDYSARDALWAIFAKYRVSALFSASERLYDRTNRAGIWQMISGGAGAPLHRRVVNNAFYHFLSLSIPHLPGKFPRVSVYDSHGHLTDAFDLVAHPYPLYQLRISKAK